MFEGSLGICLMMNLIFLFCVLNRNGKVCERLWNRNDQGSSRMAKSTIYLAARWTNNKWLEWRRVDELVTGRSIRVERWQTDRPWRCNCVKNRNNRPTDGTNWREERASTWPTSHQLFVVVVTSTFPFDCVALVFRWWCLVSRSVSFHHCFNWAGALNQPACLLHSAHTKSHLIEFLHFYLHFFPPHTVAVDNVVFVYVDWWTDWLGPRDGGRVAGTNTADSRFSRHD